MSILKILDGDSCQSFNNFLVKSDEMKSLCF